MPNGIELVPMDDILTFEEIVRVCEAGVRVGITKVRVTGGEPLVRKDCPDLIAMLKAIPGMEKVSLTTNGVFLRQYGDRLKKAGLDGVNISLDTTDDKLYADITGKNTMAQVMAGLNSMIERNIPVKINAVLMADINPQEWEPLTAIAGSYPADVRFIELMPIGEGKQHPGISNKDVYQQICRKYPSIQPDLIPRGDGPAVYYQIPGFSGRIGFISAIHGRFCSSCNRIRLTAEGKLKPCLCFADAIDIKEILRRRSAEALAAALMTSVQSKPPGHCFEDDEMITESRQMFKIGG